MKWYPWLNAPYRQIVRQYQYRRGHHAILLHASGGCGDDSLIYALSRWLICRDTQEYKSCGKCHSCRLMIAGTYPDLYHMQPETGKSGIGIELIRQIIEKLYLHAHQGGTKVVLLPLVETLTEAATNALLKTIEEPPDQTYFLLGTREPAHLPATLRSRCFYLHIPTPTEEYALHWLNSQRPGHELSMRTALRLNAGAPVAAFKVLTTNMWTQRMQLALGLKRTIPQQQWIQLLPLLDHDNFGDCLTWLCLFLLDALKINLGIKTTLANLDQQQLISHLASVHTNKILQQQLEQWIFCRHRLLTTIGLNRELMLTRQLCLWSDSCSDKSGNEPRS
ncbi:DNA polymerase III subunit delta' [Candidatus Profftia tarda]|uniref:DNA-directed DNA polymerase n=1 Tax=Candidatus Profftia tarda TaxID=1177216 RepID=A0A8E4GHR6_9ENTR|nr:DNA polymerase III subunit delta' [Candidatus Profftia tarda]CAD6509141.1 DNA polymerase III subunit delta' [Candidatus Profftia tarda]